MSAPRLTTVVVVWRSGADAGELARAFPRDPRFELVLVDNGGEIDLDERPGRRILRPGRNLGFAGGSNLGARAAAGDLLLFLNPDARPLEGALERLLEGFEARPEAAGLVPRLVSPDGTSQAAWQLRPLPGAASLVAHAFFWNPSRGPASEPPAGSRIAQPAAAALALRRSAFEAVGGFDERFHPAWFEDVDLARRLDAAGQPLLYHPEATFSHRIGSSLPALGYGGFLIAYDRSLERYLTIHHGRAWALAFRALVPIGALLRLLLVPLVKPARAATRAQAATALVEVAKSALAGFPSFDGTPP
ncbi:MAG: glycosyltransferase [Holophagales bacterium]|nr:glycosyltransferase [Holophagales bacterium]